MSSLATVTAATMVNDHGMPKKCKGSVKEKGRGSLTSLAASIMDVNNRGMPGSTYTFLTTARGTHSPGVSKTSEPGQRSRTNEYQTQKAKKHEQICLCLFERQTLREERFARRRGKAERLTIGRDNQYQEPSNPRSMAKRNNGKKRKTPKNVYERMRLFCQSKG
jgi:hypothetical protein